MFFSYCLASRLVPIHIDLHLKKNLEEHSTIFYDLPGLLLRRGQPFSLSFRFNQCLNNERSHLSLIFQCETWTNFPPIKVPLDDGNIDKWSVERLVATTDDHLSINISSPSDLPIGKYSVQENEMNKKKTNSH